MLIKQMNINVDISGNGENAIIFLHGWGQNNQTFSQIIKYFQENYKIYNIDLPGFGLSDKPAYPFSTSDYARILKEIIVYYKIEKPIIIGHSFGGRVAIKYTALYNGVKKLVLVNSAGIVNKKKLTYYIKVYTYKFLKKCFSLPLLKKYKEKVLSYFGSSDYRKADEKMKQTLVKVVNEDLRDLLELITCPTLLIWGENDNITPLSDAYIMQKHLLNSGIVKIKNAGHFSYLDNPQLFISVLDVFLNEDK